MYTADCRSALRERLALPSDEAIFLIIGCLSQRKGVSLAAAAWELLPTPERPVLLLVGSVDEDLRQEIDELQAGDLMSTDRLLVREDYVSSDD
ncbi:MAG: hypothetical protein ACREMY_17780, partial [bacterium]